MQCPSQPNRNFAYFTVPMKIHPLLICILFTQTVCGQTSSVHSKGDSLVVLDKDIVTDLFNLGATPLQKLTQNTQPKPAVEKQPVRNLHDNTRIDTAFRLAFDKDIFIALKSFDGSNKVIHADVESNLFPTRQGIRVGMTKDEVRKTLGSYKLPSVPKYLVLRDPATSDFVVLYFKEEMLVFVEYFAPAR